MAIEDLPAEKRDSPASGSLDEKYDEKADRASVVHSVHVDDVYADVRDIDLGDDGKERPIGESLIITPRQRW